MGFSRYKEEMLKNLYYFDQEQEWSNIINKISFKHFIKYNEEFNINEYVEDFNLRKKITNNFNNDLTKNKNVFKSNENNYNFINLNDELKEAIDNNYKNLFNRFKKNYQNSLKKIIKKVSKKENIYCEYYVNEKYNKIVDALNPYLHNKEILPELDDNFEHIQIKDKNVREEDSKKNLIPDVLSDGEKKLFAIASIFLENEQKNENNLYIWDEIELNFHPKWQIEILYFIKNILGKLGNSILICSTHSSHIALKTYLDDGMELLNLKRKDNMFQLEKINLDNDHILKEYLNLNKDFFKDCLKIKGKTLFVEGKSDKIYLDKMFKNDVSIEVIAGQDKLKGLKTGIDILNIRKDQIIILLDNDSSHFTQEEIDNGTYFKTKNCMNLHILPELKKDKSIEYYFKDLLIGKKIKIKNETQEITIIEKNTLENYLYYFDNFDNNKEFNEFNELEEKMQKMIESKIKKEGILFCDDLKWKDKNIRIKNNEKEDIYLPSKTEIAEWLVKNETENIKKKLKDLFNSINNKFEEIKENI